MLNNNIPIIIKKSMTGKKTNNQEIVVCPSLQIRLRTHVQNNIYINFTINIRVVLGTAQEKLPIW